MNRYLRVALLVLALVVVVAGTALANRGKADEHRSPNAASHQPETSAAEKAGTETSSDAISSKLLDQGAHGGRVGGEDAGVGVEGGAQEGHRCGDYRRALAQG